VWATDTGIFPADLSLWLSLSIAGQISRAVATERAFTFRDYLAVSPQLGGHPLVSGSVAQRKEPPIDGTQSKLKRFTENPKSSASVRLIGLHIG
jgi:hypothetical protein